MAAQVNPIDVILDPNNNDNVIFNGPNDEEVEFEQLAVIPMDGKTYVILRPVVPGPGISDDEAFVYEILDDALELVEDEQVIDEVFLEYYKLLDNAQENEEDDNDDALEDEYCFDQDEMEEYDSDDESIEDEDDFDQDEIEDEYDVCEDENDDESSQEETEEASFLDKFEQEMDPYIFRYYELIIKYCYEEDDPRETMKNIARLQHILSRYTNNGYHKRIIKKAFEIVKQTSFDSMKKIVKK